MASLAQDLGGVPAAQSTDTAEARTTTAAEPVSPRLDLAVWSRQAHHQVR
jgi:hypothetical protein